jgi:hypothetical protein
MVQYYQSKGASTFFSGLEDVMLLVAPQGFVDIANKQDLGFFHSDTPIDTPS